jgi:xanthine/CO dehydrogenase XdhC/CoxF family maturation factor
VNSRLLIASFETWRAARMPLVLVTVFDTLGSTYSKAGHRILIAGDGRYQGLVSGGCLEGDLVEHARQVLEQNRAVCVTYDLRDEAEDLFGLGIGCNGLLRMLLQPLTAAAGFEPFSGIAECQLGHEPGAVVTIIDSAAADVSAGGTLVRAGRMSSAFGIPDRLAAEITRLAERSVTAERASIVSLSDGIRALCAPLKPIPRLLVLGGGLDAVPLVNMAAEIGWRVTVADHRPAYIERNVFGAAESALIVEPDRLSASLALARFDAIVVMSHHLATDERYLAELADYPGSYLGLLGPPARKTRLLTALGELGAGLEARLHGPVGLDIGADSAETIALSILAEMQARLSAPSDAG